MKQLTVKEIIECIKKYNIPENARIELATGWECSPTEAHVLYYNIFTNTLSIITEGTEDWYNNPDIICLIK